MDSIRRIKLRWLHGTLGDVGYQFTRVRFAPMAPQSWQPAINAFRCEKGIRICVDLAGVDRSMIDLAVQPQRLVIRGERQPPEPSDAQGRAIQMLAFEIDYGPFERTVDLPERVDVEGAQAEQTNGLLWINLPFHR